MKLITSRQEMAAVADQHRTEGLSTGFVPTLGALHQGHMSLVNRALSETDLVIVSVFVNPTQFNNPEDFRLYPRNNELDLTLLENSGCHIAFFPSEKDMYPGNPSRHFDFHGLDTVMEGKFRPGHFQGVADIVLRFLEMIKPDRAYFGLKDYQQLAIVRQMVQDTQLATTIVACPTIRESDGLAMSSRNARLSPEERKSAPAIYQTLLRVNDMVKEKSITEVKNFVSDAINAAPHLKLEYFEIVDADSLLPLDKWAPSIKSMACIAVFAGNVRLIDNISL